LAAQAIRSLERACRTALSPRRPSSNVSRRCVTTPSIYTSGRARSPFFSGSTHASNSASSAFRQAVSSAVVAYTCHLPWSHPLASHEKRLLCFVYTNSYFLHLDLPLSTCGIRGHGPDSIASGTDAHPSLSFLLFLPSSRLTHDHLSSIYFHNSRAGRWRDLAKPPNLCGYRYGPTVLSTPRLYLDAASLVLPALFVYSGNPARLPHTLC